MTIGTTTSKQRFSEEQQKLMYFLEDRLMADDMADHNLDPEYADGVLNLPINGFGTWVINKHSASRQIWLSSPLSGPNKYDFHEEAKGRQWLGERDQHSLHDHLENEWSQALNIDFSFKRVF